MPPLTSHPVLRLILGLALTLLSACSSTDHVPEAQTVEESAQDTPRTPSTRETELQPHPAPDPCQGYILYSDPLDVKDMGLTVLTDMEGRIVKRWNVPGFPALFMPGGSLLTPLRLRTMDQVRFQDSVEIVEISWSGQILWSFSDWDDDGSGTLMSRQHHDLVRAGSPVGYFAPGQTMDGEGPTLVLAHASRDVPAVSPVRLTDDVIYDVSRDGSFAGFIWFAGDHIDEMGFDASARQAIYHAPLRNDSSNTVDWLHINSIARLGRNRWFEMEHDARFHPDHVLIGSREANFLAIIDHETGHLVWRAGPDFVPGTPMGQIGQLVGQHHAHMIPHGLPGAGNILVFDNGGVSGYGGTAGYPRYTRFHSRVVEFDPITFRKVWEYGPSDGTERLFSAALGSVQRLPNGNTLITSGMEARLLEVTPTGQIAWRLNPQPIDGHTFIYRAFRVPPEWLPPGANTAGYRDWSQRCSPGLKAAPQPR